MRFKSKVLFGVVATFLVMALPLGAFTLVELNQNQQKVPVAMGATFNARVQLSQAAFCDGSHKLPAGLYRVEIFSMGDGSVRASFFDQSGRKAGEAHGIIAVLRSAAAAAPAGRNLPAVQSQSANAATGAASPAGRNLPAVQSQSANGATGAQASPAGQVALNFAQLGFEPNSRSTFSQQGQKLNLAILSRDGSHSVLIGLLLPAV